MYINNDCLSLSFIHTHVSFGQSPESAKVGNGCKLTGQCPIFSRFWDLAFQFAESRKKNVISRFGWVCIILYFILTVNYNKLGHTHTYNIIQLHTYTRARKRTERAK